MEEEEGSSFTVVEQLAARGEVTAGFLTKPPGPAETKTIATRDPLPDEAPPQNDSGPSIRISPVVSDKKANPGEPALSDNVFRHAGTDGLRLQIDESWLPEGSLYNGGGLPVYEARFLIASNDGIDCIAIDEIPFHIGEEGVLTAAEEHGDCRFNGSWGHLTGSVSAIDDGLYILHLFYTQTSAVAHDTGQKLPMTAGAEFFGIAVYSETGKSSHSCLSIAIADDTPVLSLLSSAGSVFEGEVLTGSWDVKMGADAEKSTIHVEYKNRQYGIGEVIEIDGGGSLTVGEDHTWTFTARPNDIYRNADQAVTFSVVAEDGDGDIVSKSLSFSARDDLSDVVTVKLSATEEIEEDGRNGKNLITYTATLVDRNQNPVTAQSDVRASLDLDDGSKTEIIIAKGSSSGVSEPVHYSGPNVYRDDCSLSAKITGVSQDSPDLPGAFENLHFDGTPVLTRVTDTIDVTYANVFIQAEGEDVVVRVVLDSPPDAGRTATVTVLVNGVEYTLNFTDADIAQSVVLEGALRQSAITDKVSVSAEILSFDAADTGNYEAAQPGDNAKAAEVFYVAPRTVTVGLSASDVFEDAPDTSYVFTATLSEAAPAGGVAVITSLGSIHIAEGKTQGELVISSGQTEDVWLDATSLTAAVLSVESAFLNVTGAGEEATAFVRDTIDVTCASVFIHADGEDVVVRVLLDSPPDAGRTTAVAVLINEIEHTLNFTDADVTQSVVLEGALRQSAISDRVSVTAEIISFDADGAGNFEAAQLGNNAKAAEVFDVTPRMVTVGLSASDIFENAVDASYMFTATLSEAAPVGGVTVITSLGSIYIAEGDAQGKLVISSGQTEDVWLDATSLTATVLSVESAFLNVVGAGEEATAFVRDTIDVTYANLFIHADGEDVVVRVLLDNPPDATREARVTVLVNGTEYTLNFTDADVAQKVVLEGALRQSAIADRVSVAAEIISFDADGAGNYEAARLGPYAKTGEDFYVAPRAVTVGLSASDVFEDALDSSYEFTATLSEAAPAGGVTVMTSLGSIYIAEGDTEGKLAIPSGQTEDVWLDATFLTAKVLSVESAFLNVTGPGEETTAFVRDTIDVTTASVFISQGESPGDLVVTVRLSAPADPAIPGGKAAVSVMIGKESFILEFAGSETEKELILQNHLLNNADSEGNVEVEAVIADFTGGNYESHGGTGSRAIAEFKLPPGPVAADDHAIIDEDGPKTITGNVLANDEGADISVTPESTVSDVRIDYGWLSLKADGSYTFLLDETDEDVVALFAGTDGSGGMLQTSFDYAIVDGLGRSSEATLLIDIIDNRQIIGTSGDDIISGGQGRDVIVGDPGAEGFSSFVPDMNVAVVFDASASMLGNGFDEARLALAQLVLQYSAYEGNVNMSITAFSTDISASISNSSLDSPNITAGEIRTDSFATVRVHGEAVTVGVLSDGTVISDRSDLEFRLNNGVLQYRTRETSLPSDWTANFLNVPSEWYGGAMIEAVLGLEADDETNFEAGLNAASYWLQNQNDAINVVYFICDGMPTNYYRDTATAPVTINNDRAVSILDYNRMVAGMKSAVSISGNSITLTYEGNRVVSSDSEIHQFRLNPINSRLEYSSTQGWTAVAGHVDWVLSVAVPDHNVPDLYWAGVQVWYDSAGNQTGIQYPGQSIEGTSQDASWWIDESGRFLRWDGSEWHEVREQVLRHGAGTATTAVELEQSKAAFDRLVDAFTDEHGATHVYVFTIGISLTPENMGFLDGLDNTGGAFAISHARELFDALRESQVDFYHALAGNDIIHGGPGEDIIFGDAINADHLLPEITEGTWAAGLHAGDGLKILAAWLDADNAPGFTGSGEGVRLYLAHLAGSGNEDDFAELLRLGSSETHRGGSDILAGGEGNDILFGQAGNDVIFGGEVHYAGLKGASAIMKLIDGAGGSVEDVSAFLAARPETFLEMRAHGSEADGENLLCGGLGNDILIGGGMNDILVGGAGDNILFGGKGSDIFVYSGASLEGKESGDVILDFNAGSVDGDILDIRDLLTDLDLDNDLNALFDGGGLSLKVEKGEGDTATVVLGIDHAGHAGSIASIHMSGVLLDDTLGSLEEQLLMQLVDGNHILF